MFSPAGLSNIVAIAAGGASGANYGHNLALKSDGKVVGWGDNVFGQTNVPAGLSNVVAIAAGGNHSLAITAKLRINSVRLTNQIPAIEFRTFSGQLYLVEYSPGFNPGSWFPLPGSDVSGNGYDAQVTDTNAVAFGMRFYRLKQQ
ncbi:MAG: hypothetical protein HY298_22245 [Verrucomicrobia bacterium]|nr:hypothetical protein [Verrucomicrobiota bacterium]